MLEAVAGGLGSGETDESSHEWVTVARKILQSALGSKDGQVRRAAGETLASLAVALGEGFTQSVTSLLQSIDTGLGQGLIPLGKEDAIVDQLQLAHKNGLIKFEDKDGIYCVDIVNLAKFSGDPKYADLHEMLQRVDGLTNAGVSVSSGGGGQHGKSRVHFRQPREGRRTTPGRTQRHHLDTVSDKDVPEYVRKLWLADPLNRHETP